MGFTYKDAGVDIEKGDRFARFISNSESKAVAVGGGFAGGVELDMTKYKQPVILSTTDGVGTKLLVAQELEQFDTVGIDLVAMSVNDLIVCNAEPLSFLDYIACGTINEQIMQQVIKGIVKGCEQAECTLNGGETAEMPDLYKENDFDLAGFCLGVADKERMLPNQEKIEAGDIVFGLPSVGIHSNGLSLARKVITPDNTAYQLLLEPTKIYVKELKRLFSSNYVTAAAHITGGGLEANTERVIPDGLSLDLTWDWPVPEIFAIIQSTGDISTVEMRKVFNMGIGISIIVPREHADEFAAFANKSDIKILRLGQVQGKLNG